MNEQISAAAGEPPRTREQIARGMLCAVLSALLFGVGPGLARLSYTMGNNGVNATFLRCVFALPFLFALSRRERAPRPAPFVWGKILASGLLAGATTLLLYSSYNYIGSGIATTLHFIYPLVVVLLTWAVYGKRPALREALGLLAGLVGVACFASDFDVSQGAGVAMALLSGCTYAGYILLSGSRGARNVPCFTFAMYLTAVSACLSGGYGLATGSLRFDMPLAAWGLCLLIGLMESVAAIVLFQTGIRLAGGPKTALLSLFEPLTGMLCGFVFFGDPLSVAIGVGCVCVLGSLTLTLLPAGKKRAARG